MLALVEKGVPFASHYINMLEFDQHQPEYLAVNPQGLVPTLEADGLVLTQSLAIIDWLDATYPEPRLIPTDPAARAQALAQAMVVAMDIHPINNLRVMRWLTHELQVDEAKRAEWTRHWIAEGFAALEAMAGDGPFLGGAAPGIADVFLVPQMFNARRFDVPLAAYPNLVTADAACAEIEAFAAAHPDRVGA